MDERRLECLKLVERAYRSFYELIEIVNEAGDEGEVLFSEQVMAKVGRVYNGDIKLWFMMRDDLKDRGIEIDHTLIQVRDGMVDWG